MLFVFTLALFYNASKSDWLIKNIAPLLQLVGSKTSITGRCLSGKCFPVLGTLFMFLLSSYDWLTQCSRYLFCFASESGYSVFGFTTIFFTL